MGLTQEQMKFLNSNGYIVVDDVFSRQQTQEFCDTFLEHAKHNGNHNLETMLHIHKEVPTALDIFRNPEVVSIAEQVLCGESGGLQTLCVFKMANTPSAKYAWEPHQDNSYLRANPNESIHVNLALDDHLPGNGCMYVYPGSHKEPLLPYEPSQAFGKLSNNPGNRVKDIPKQYEKIELRPKKGSGMILHAHVIHGSSSNNSENGWRPMLLMAFIRKGAKFSPGRTANRETIDLK